MVTKQLAQLVATDIKNLSDAHVKALSKSFGNFDRVVAQGWLVADALGLPLLLHKQAHAVGLKVRRAG